jgi:hypothetical protein
VIPVGDRFFGAPNLRVKQGSWVTWQFNGRELHNVTLANGPLGIGTDNLDGQRTFTEKLSRPGTYRFFCALHPRADAGAGDRHPQEEAQEVQEALAGSQSELRSYMDAKSASLH